MSDSIIMPMAASANTASSDACPMTGQQWCAWLDKQESISFDEYKSRPSRLVSDFNGEKTFINDYIGREILELLQNANDAAAKAGIRSHVRFELLPSGLIAANTGEPFSQAGVASLCLPHTSPKPAEGPQMVGNKGLGFRAVLNWTRFPIILSAELAIVFSARVAKQKQAELAQLNEALSSCIERQKKLSGELVVPLLAFPGFCPDGDLGNFLDDEAQCAVYARCRELRKEGYDTVIGMPFDRESSHTAALRQIRVLRPEVLLFARSIERLEVAVKGMVTDIWRHYPNASETSRVYLGKDDTNYREWKVYSRSDAVPSEYLPSDQPSATDYELVLAIPTNHKPEAGCLYSYFPTEVRFPYPMVCHATLDLKADRQQPQGTPANHFIVGVLAEFMAQIAERLARESSDEAGLKLLAAQSTTSDGLEQFSFRSRLLDAAKKRALIPTLANGLVTPGNARRVDFADTSWLPKAVFPTVVNLQDSTRLGTVLEWLDVPSLGSSDWLQARSRLAFETIGELADFIAGIIRYVSDEADAFTSLLLDADRDPVPKGYRVFLPPTTQTDLSLPPWFEIRFLHPDLRQALMDRLKPKDQDALAASLSPLGVSRYSLDSVLSALVGQANRRADAEPAQQDDIRLKLMQALRSLFPENLSKDDRPRFPKDALVLVRSLAGTYEDARTLYLSAEYGSRGRILEDLYRPFAPAKLVAAPVELGMQSGDPSAAEFLLWFGLADVPRETVTKSPEYQFGQHVKSNLSEPVKMEDYIFQRVEDLPSLTLEVVSLDGLESFLTLAPPAAVLAWLATDYRAIGWKSPSALHGKVGCWQSRAWRARFYDGPIPSYIRWKLQTTKWLPTRLDRLEAPQECLAEAVQGIEDLLPLPARPTPEQAQRYGVPAQQFRDAFDRAGVLPGFSQIDPEQLYELLLSLPSRDPAASIVKSVYHAVLRHFESADVRGCAARERFVRSGKLWARTEAGEKYCPIQEVRHVDSEDIPATLCRKVNVAALPKRSGNQKVEALFGVKAIERSHIQRRILRHQPVCDASVISDEIEQVKPLVLALRRSQMQRARESAQFRQLKVTVCSSVEGEVEYNGQKEPLQLGSWDWILDDETHTAYVLSDPQESDLLDSDLLADAVGQIFAAVFRVERGDEFARLVGCHRKDRLQMLRRLVGDDDIPAMEELERRYREAFSDAEAHEIRLPDSALVSPSLANIPSTSDIQPTAPGPQEPAADTDIDKPLLIESKPHTPGPPAAEVECRVSRRMPVGPRNFSGTRRVTDGTFCEYKAMEFEKYDAPPRFPVRVGNITGWGAPGVDVLSFATEQDRAQFLAGDRREALVERFIEVKGRSSEGAKIDLRDNAIIAARKYQDKYYLYRIFDRGDSSYELAVLKNPLADETGVRPFYEVNLEAATRTEEFSLAGGIAEGSYRDQLVKSDPVLTAGTSPI